MKHKVKYELYCINPALAVAVGILLVVVNFSIWCAVGSPIFVIRYLSSKIFTFPLWLYGLFDFLSFGMLGFSLGADLLGVCRVNEVARYRGAFFFILGIVFSYLHHLFFFPMSSFFMALILGIIAVAFLIFAIMDLRRVSKIASLFAMIGSLWRLYVCIFSIAALFLA